MLSVGACNVTGNVSFAILLRRTDATNDGKVWSMNSNATTNVCHVDIDSAGAIGYDVGPDSVAPFTILTSDGWVLLVITKTTGTSFPRFHKYVYSTNTWTHGNGDASVGNYTLPGASGNLRIGSSEDGDSSFFEGDVALEAMFNYSLTDAQVENLAFSLAHWHSLAPIALWLLDQSLATQNVVDLTGGGANQSSLTGTSIVTDSPLFSYGGSVIPVRSVAAPAATLFRRTLFLRTGARGAMGGI